MSFEVDPAAYDRFMGRLSVPLASELARFADVGAGDRILDVGCGPGALTAELLRLDAEVAAADPSESFVAAIRSRFPGVDVRLAYAEDLPFSDATFDRTLSQLAVHFFGDPVGGLREMRRVTRPGGVVATAVWDLAARATPLGVFWDAAKRLDPSARDESWRAGTQEGQLAELSRAAGLRDVEASVLTISTSFDDFEDWWAPFTLGVGPAGAYVLDRDDEVRALLREQCRALLPSGPFTQDSPAWAVRGLA